MGIGVYVKCHCMSDEVKHAQITLQAPALLRGHVGYVREAYHASPYETPLLVPAAFDGEEGEAESLPGFMRQRLRWVVEAGRQREKLIRRDLLNRG